MTLGANAGRRTAVSRALTAAGAVLLAAALWGTSPAAASPAGEQDAAFRDGWRLLAEEKYGEAAAKFASIPLRDYDLGDYVLYFQGIADAGLGDVAGAGEILDNLAKSYPASPLPPYLAHEIAFAAVKEEDLASARSYLSLSRGRVTGNGRKAEEGYVAARLLEAEGPGAGPAPGKEASAEEEGNPPPRPAVEAHLDNFAAWPVQEGGLRSMERLWKWRSEGRLAALDLPVTFQGRLAKTLAVAGEIDRARAVYREAIRKFPPSDDYYAVLLDFAEFLRRQWDTRESRALLEKASKSAPRSFKSEIDFLFARVELKAGRNTDARLRFLEIAGGDVKPAVAERARYQAAWIAEEDGDLAAATEEFGKLRDARDESIRQEAIFRHAFGLLRQKRHAEAIESFGKGIASGFSTVEKSRHAYWRARALVESGEREKGEAELKAVAADAGAGPFAFFALAALGRDPYALLAAPAPPEPVDCARGKEDLWEAVRGADWGEEDRAKIARAERLIALGVAEYAIFEADRIDRAKVRKTLGANEGGAPGLFRYLAGDFKGAMRETNGVPIDPASPAPGLVDRIQFPLAPEYVGDCRRKIAGIDPLVLHAVIRQESQFQLNALSPAGAVGLMQLMPRTAVAVARKERKPVPGRRDLLKAERNVDLGAAYFARLLRTYGGDYVRAVAAYNAGEAAVGRWWEAGEGDPGLFLERMTYRETRFYVRRVFFNLLQYYRIYRPGVLAQHQTIAPKEGTPAPGASGTPPGGGSPGTAPSGPGSAADAPPGG